MTLHCNANLGSCGLRQTFEYFASFGRISTICVALFNAWEGFAVTCDELAYMFHCLPFQEPKKDETFGLVIPGKSLVSETCFVFLLVVCSSSFLPCIQ